ncbi:MAG: hypothetical protein WBM98_02215 [Maribacter sp.]|uniref:hypothetical protein n=1 Tax=Maribacter sp. TaxID=1897614 RepID=UPI003C75AB94
MTKTDNNQFPTKNKSWLQRLKDESWEAELLVSAVAIFAILKSFFALDWLVIQFIDYLDPNQYIFGYYITVSGYLAVGILAAMFAIHFVLRAYWIGLVGLNSVFPDYGLEDSAYSPIYTKKILSILPKLSNSIRKIDELCSVIFSAAFGLMLIYLYIAATSSLYLICFNLLKDTLPLWVLLVPLIVAGSLIIFGMIISIPANIKKFHGNQTIQHLYFLYARWGALILYGPFQKSILQITMVFGSNFKKKKGLIKMVIFMLFIGFVFGMVKMFDSNFRYLLNHERELDTSKKHSFFYQSLNSKNSFLLAPEIKSDVVDSPILEIFVPIFEHERVLLENHCGLPKTSFFSKLDEEVQKKRRIANLNCYQNSHRLFIDNKPQAIDFIKSEHINTQQFGILGHIDLTGISTGNHTIKVKKVFKDSEFKEWSIPFYHIKE